MAQTKPKAGQFYGVSNNGTDGQFLQTDGTGGMAWADTTIDPTLTSIDYPGTQTAADPAGGESIIINGTGFQTGITCTIGGTSATTAFNSATQITITSPAKAAGQYTVAVTNTDGGSGSSANFIQYSGVPVWSTNSGSLGSVMEGETTSFQVTATEGSDTIEYAVTSGSLPSGYSLATATGAITGTAGAVSADTTSTFSITATDDENQTSSARSFSITVTNDVPSNYFNPILYTGNSSTQSFTTVGFQPDFTWIKERNASEAHFLQDSLRGSTMTLYSNGAYQQFPEAQGVTSFTSTGFDLGSYQGMNLNGNTYVAWNWKAGGAPTATNSAGAGNAPTVGSVMIDGVASTAALAGTIPAKKMSVNTTLGFSIVEFEGNATSGATIAHGLGGDADMVIVKSTNLAQAWNVYIKNVTDTDSKYLRLNTDDSIASLSTSNYRFIVNNFSSTVFSVGSDNAVNGNGDDYVTYCFKSTTGFSKVGSYTGNGSSNGPMIETGFEPAFLIIKRTDSTANWRLLDNKRSPNNPRDKELYPNLSNAEGTYSSANFYANGFELITSDANYNASGGIYIYMAMAADPSTTTPSLANSFSTKVFTPTNQSTALPVTGMGFKPDMVWTKYRDGAMSHYMFDSVRGESSIIFPNLSNIASTSPQYVQSFDSGGITFVNNLFNRTNTDSAVAWAWKAGGLGSINTDGTINSIVSVNQAAGFSITQYAGTGSALTFGHGLGAVPKMTIIKGLTGTARNWVVFHEDLTAPTYEVYLSDQGSEYNSAGAMQAAAPTSTLISLGTDDYANGSGNKYICYSFAEITGFSSFGKYTASGSSGSPTITTGFQPDCVIIKNIDRTQEWIIIDSVRGLNKSLIPDSNAAESVNGNIITTNATSFTIDVSGGGINYASGDTMIYAAFKIN